MDEVKAYGWGILTLVLFFTTFGFCAPVYLLVYLITFIAGCGIIAYQHGCYFSEGILESETGFDHLPYPKPGLQKLTDQVKKGDPKYKIDKRLSGANIIDEPLQEVLEYAFRDYVRNWYNGRVSDHEEFLHYLRQSVQNVIVSFSNRSKEVQWVPYFTRRLVDDFASHVRLYRNALEKLNKIQCTEDDAMPTLESMFFDLEVEMEGDKCRDLICLSPDQEAEYLRDVTEMLLFLLLPAHDFYNKPFRYLLREVIVFGILQPMIDRITEPDYINQTIIWMCKDHAPVISEGFLTIIKLSNNIGELEAVIEKLDHEISVQRSRDSSADDIDIKMQLNSLQHVRRVSLETLQRLLDGELDMAMEAGQDIMTPLQGQSLYSLPLDVVLVNNVALSYFIEFMGQMGGQGYLFFWLTIESYKVMAEQQLSAYHLQKLQPETVDVYGGPDPEMLRAAALNIFEQYLADDASHGIHVGEQIVKKTYHKIKNEPPTECVFDDVQKKVYEILQGEPFFPAFKQTSLYVKCLAELDLLKDESPKIDDRRMSLHSADSSPSNSLQGSTEDLLSSSLEESCTAEMLSNSHFSLKASIENTAIVKESGKSYGVYSIHVQRTNADNTEEVWDVYRRYSDFHDLHMVLKEKFESLFGLSLPGKKAFNNTSKSFLEKRTKQLNSYLQTLLCHDVLSNNPGMLGVLVHFLEPGVYNKGKGQFARKMDTLVNPLKNSVRNVAHTVKSVPGNIVDGMVQMSGELNKMSDRMTDSFTKMFKGNQRDHFFETEKVSANIGADDDDNIPLRIMLLLLDEVFDLKSRDQWLRKRMIALLRQFIKAAFGNMINTKIVDYVAYTTSAEQVAEYVKLFRDSFWPDGIEADSAAERDNMTMMRTRVIAKTKLIASMPDELKNFIGAETTRKGILRVFEMLQNQQLNKRLMYVCFEGMLETLFPDNTFPEVFRKLHSRSERLRNKPAPAARRPGAKKRGILERGNSHRKSVLQRTDSKQRRNKLERTDSEKRQGKLESKNSGTRLDRGNSVEGRKLQREKSLNNQYETTSNSQSLSRSSSESHLS
ncbi:sorting nexin-13-like [Ptychodera flava]|uniref:sorting nexin-13-like n=1 Tax=Ptychodera flava TaxID=63121 RepID=UPI00396A80C0